MKAAREQFEDKYGREALFRRYARARIRQFLLRQVATLIGGIAVYHIVSPLAALVCILLALLGETVDVLCLLRARAKLDAGHSFSTIRLPTAISAGVQSATISSCVLILLLMAPTDEAALIALCFLMAAAVNAGFVMSHHREASWVKLGVLSLCVPIYMFTDTLAAGHFGQRQLIHTLEILMLGYMTYTFVAFTLASWKRRMRNERQLMESAARLDLANHDLVRAQKEAEQAAQAKSAFLATMSHEIRTPLNAVIGMSDLLAGGKLDAESEGYVDTIRSASTSLLAIINDVLDFSRLDAGQMAFEALPFAPAEAIAGAARMLTPLAQEKGLRLVLADDGSLPARASADEGRLRQILVNLIGNAIKFTETGEVRVTSRARPEGDGWKLIVEVSDTGVGVPRDRAEAIFEVFQQADAATTRRYGGTGLGLPISRALARRMGGDIRLLPGGSTPGACFQLCVLLDIAPAEAPAVAAGLKQVISVIDAPISVLVADDNETNRMLVRQFLKSEMIDLREVGDGKAALAATQASPPDVILMDMAMPELDGLEATRAIRKLDIPQPWIIAITANAFASDQQACLDAGMDAFLTKPLRKAVLVSALAQVSHERAARRPETKKTLSPPPLDTLSRQDVSAHGRADGDGGDNRWTSPHGSGTTNGRSIRSSGH